MKRILNIVLLGSIAFAGVPLMVGCDKTTSEEKTTEDKPNGTVTKKKPRPPKAPTARRRPPRRRTSRNQPTRNQRLSNSHQNEGGGPKWSLRLNFYLKRWTARPLLTTYPTTPRHRCQADHNESQARRFRQRHVCPARTDADFVRRDACVPVLSGIAPPLIQDEAAVGEIGGTAEVLSLVSRRRWRIAEGGNIRVDPQRNNIVA